MLSYKPNQLNKQCQIGIMKTTVTSTGGKVSSLDESKSKTVWYGSKMRTLALQYQLIGTQISDTFEIVVRHNPWFATSMCAVIDSKYYDIVNISPDETPNLQAFDILTLKVKGR